ncbi:MAG TPA: 8-oxo-dGTP diphosphatase MutT [Firmicutes bacterium]|nr:8-oxo-dGTP diphosphatase MutT [Bacillota bacterium]HBM70252.1 8-oxo-dGTP diphosphatase MutT [Bacillota bacterium]
MKIIKVVAAIIKKDNLVFVSQRGYGEFKDKWEFPGGKIEANESKEEALKREIKEELDASINIIENLKSIEYDYPNFHLIMDVFLCHLNNPHLELKEAENAKWIKKEEINQLDWLPADKLLVKDLEEELFK